MDILLWTLYDAIKQTASVRRLSKNSIELRFEDTNIFYTQLLWLTEYFGTVDLGLSSWYEEGCPTCGGSNIIDITVRGITKNFPFKR